MSKERLFKSTHYGELKIGETLIQCYVLDDGRRVLSGRGMQGALNLGQTSGQKIEQLANNNSIKPLINNELALGIFNPIKFKSNNNLSVFGYDAKKDSE